jgi:hypothetical protein
MLWVEQSRRWYEYHCWSKVRFSGEGTGAARRMYLRWKMSQERGGGWFGGKFPLQLQQFLDLAEDLCEEHACGILSGA